MDRGRQTLAVCLALVGLVAAGCGQAGPDPQAEAQQKVEADALMQQYNTPAPPQKP
jgi:hypothetical protein